MLGGVGDKSIRAVCKKCLMFKKMKIVPIFFASSYEGTGNYDLEKGE
jgi:hypothetical protein